MQVFVAKSEIGERGATLVAKVKMQNLPSHRSQLDAASDVPQVLIVDDEVEILRSFSRMLRLCDVQKAQGGAAAIGLLEKRSHFDVIVLDLMMPVVDGQAVLSWMQEHAPHLVERVVLITAGAFTESSIAFLSSWQGAVLEKPVPLNTMRKQVAHVFHTFHRDSEQSYAIQT